MNAVPGLDNMDYQEKENVHSILDDDDDDASDEYQVCLGFL